MGRYSTTAGCCSPFPHDHYGRGFSFQQKYDRETTASGYGRIVVNESHKYGTTMYSSALNIYQKYTGTSCVRISFGDGDRDRAPGLQFFCVSACPGSRIFKGDLDRDRDDIVDFFIHHAWRQTRTAMFFFYNETLNHR